MGKVIGIDLGTTNSVAAVMMGGEPVVTPAVVPGTGGITLSPGQTTDELFAWTDVEHWDPVENTIPVVIPQLQKLTFATFYSGSPYLGNTDILPVGHQALNACGEYYHISHNHALQQITADYPETFTAQEAEYRLGVIILRAGQYQEALDVPAV